MHQTMVATMLEFKKVMQDQIKPLPQIFEKSRQDRIAIMNQQKGKPIIETVVFCGRQNMPLHGHRDDNKHLCGDSARNFQELLDFRIDSGDEVLEEHFEIASWNATYCSKAIQNEIIDCCGDVIMEQIVEEIKESKFFSIMADEAQDCANKEQMSLVIRYVEQSEIREAFIRFILCNSGLTGLALSEKKKKAIDDLGLEMEDCRRQCYDGTANMARKCTGAAAWIHEE